MLVTVSILSVLVISFIVFVNLYPVFGRKPAKEAANSYVRSPQYKQGKFENPVPAMMNMSISAMLGDHA